ncbi:recombinase family protein [Corynebacterium sanguinis]|uniref:Recombinase family protein n=1 Tax=Corynebacterium sanguinis TaxID=2594913 RepID=A0A6C1U289_9CORY|nr:recombinase family protein [Corynebacterium sanguinis]
MGLTITGAADAGNITIIDAAPVAVSDACPECSQPGTKRVHFPGFGPKLDRLGRDLRHLVNVVHDLNTRDVGLRVLVGQGASIDTTTAQGKLVFGIFAALAEFERELISERTKAGLASARARGRKGGRPFKMTPAKVRMAAASMKRPDTSVTELCEELGITRQTLDRYVSPEGKLRAAGQKIIDRKG